MVEFENILRFMTREYTLACHMGTLAAKRQSRSIDRYVPPPLPS